MLIEGRHLSLALGLVVHASLRATGPGGGVPEGGKGDESRNMCGTRFTLGLLELGDFESDSARSHRIGRFIRFSPAAV